MHRTLLIDGDIVVYQYSSTVEHELIGVTMWSLWADAKEATVNHSTLTFSLRRPADDFIFCFSDKDNYCKDIDSTYKSNRKGKRKPVCYKAVKEWIRPVQDQFGTG